MEPKQLKDFLPLLTIKKTDLERIRDQWRAESASIEQKHRIYYFSEKLKVIFGLINEKAEISNYITRLIQVNPPVVSEAFAKNENMFYWVLDFVEQKLNVLMAYNIPGIDILSSLGVFAMNVDTMTSKLELLNANEKEPISTWMLCCEKDRFDR